MKVSPEPKELNLPFPSGFELHLWDVPRRIPQSKHRAILHGGPETK